MNYQRLYIELIESRKDRTLDEGVYTEEHHIIPKSWGGSDDKENLILLTAKEHYVAHHLLYMFSKDYRMAFAFMIMSGRIKDERYNKHFSFITARQFEIARKITSEASKKFFEEFKNDEEKFNAWRRRLKQSQNRPQTKQRRNEYWSKQENIDKARDISKQKRIDHKESYEIQKKKITKIYKVITVTNRELYIFGLQEFADVNGLSRPKLSSVISGQREHHRGLKIHKVDESFSSLVTSDIKLNEEEILSKEEVLQIGLQKNWENRRKKIDER